jgi:probable phosphoglycerate mutase
LGLCRADSGIEPEPHPGDTIAAMHIYLVRHGQSHVNLTDLTASHRDEPLTETGQAQAAALAKHLATELHVDRLLASTVQRAAQTARCISEAIGVPVEWDDRLREVGTAHPDGSPIAQEQLRPYLPEMWGTLQPYEPVTTGGESWMQVRARVGSFIESLIPAPPRGTSRTMQAGRDSIGETPEHADQVVMVVCHAGVIEAVFEYVFEKGPWSVVAVETHHTGVTHLEFLPAPFRPDWRLHFHNRIVHLPADLVT